MLLRYIALSTYEYDSTKDVSDFLDEINYKIINEDEASCNSIKDRFEKTFRLINQALGDKSFKKDQKGKFLESAFEAIAIGVSKNIDDYDINNDIDFIKQRIESLYSQAFYNDNAGSGTNAKSRINKIIPEAINFFQKG